MMIMMQSTQQNNFAKGKENEGMGDSRREERDCLWSTSLPVSALYEVRYTKHNDDNDHQTT